MIKDSINPARQQIRMTQKHDEEQNELVTSGLSYTDTFVKRITDLLKQGLAAENYETALQNIIELCKDDYDLNRAGAAAAKLAEKQRYRSEAFDLYCKMAGDLFKMQCEAERTSGRTTIFTGFYNSAMDAYLDGGYVNEAVEVAFEHSYWLMRNALYRAEAGKQKYLELSAKAFDDVIKRAQGELAVLIYEQREGRKKAADLLGGIEPPAHLMSIEDPGRLRAGADAYREPIAFLDTTCKSHDIAAYLCSELATVLEKLLPELAREYKTMAEDLERRRVTLLAEHGIS